MPSAACGVYGMKPTHGLVPDTGILSFYPAIDHTGPMTASVGDNALFLEVLAGPDGIDPRQGGASVQPYREALGRGVSGLRIGVLEEGFGHTGLSEPEVDERVMAACDRFRALGANVEEVLVPLHRPRLHTLGRLSAVAENVFTMDGHGVGANGLHVPGFLEAQAHWRDRRDDLPPTVKLLLIYHEVLRSRHGYRMYALGANRVSRLRAAYDRALESVDLLLLPTVPFKPRPLPGEDAPPAEPGRTPRHCRRLHWGALFSVWTEVDLTASPA
ncbi:MAG: amidase family protein [Gemmatimonadota bacterium]|nr:amidase family protein [Gemmatimonadota bacterium]